MYFTSPISNISPAMASVAMSRSDSRDSQMSFTSSSPNKSAYQSLSTHASMPWPMVRSNSNTSTSSEQSSYHSSPRAISMRRDSSSSSIREQNWNIACPYRSANHASDSPSSYLTDEDLAFIMPPTSQPLAIEQISNVVPVLAKKELTTEEQIALLREQQEKEDMVREKRRVVRFVEAGAYNGKKGRRPSTLNKRVAPRRNFNGPQ